MCCLSEASSHFVVFVCVNPDRKPSRKMKRLNEEAVVRTLRQAQGPNGSDERQIFTQCCAFHEVWLRLGRVQASLTLLSARTNFGTKFAVVYKNV